MVFLAHSASSTNLSRSVPSELLASVVVIVVAENGLSGDAWAVEHRGFKRKIFRDAFIPVALGSGRNGDGRWAAAQTRQVATWNHDTTN